MPKLDAPGHAEGGGKTTLSEIEEAQYRRGYWDGYYEALSAVEMMKAVPARRLKRLWDFCQGKLEDWRYARDISKRDMPPHCG